jgi:hypothetical protein
VRQHPEQGLVEAPACVALGGGEELIVEAESVEEGSEAGIVVVPEARMIAEGIGNLGERSMSSEKQIRRVGILSSVSTRKAWRTMVVRATSPKVPIWGKPDGP